MKKNICLLLFFVLILPAAVSEEITVPRLFKDSFTYFQLLRQENGIYRDALRFDGKHIHPASISATGMGLVSLCIADTMKWVTDAEPMAIRTLQAVTGKQEVFKPARNASGYFRHWLDLKNGSRAWTSEYSTIDTAILLAGANFCKNYFHSSAVTSLVEELFSSIDWSKSIANSTTGGIHLEMQDDGSGIAGSITLPFTEYMLVAWLAKNEDNKLNRKGPATELWNSFYSDPEKSRQIMYQGTPLLTDQANRYLPDFTLQFCYYLCNYFTVSDTYMTFFTNARIADQAWWVQKKNRNAYEWGLGAGGVAYSSGYHADAINNNPGNYFSPHIIAGFIPIYNQGLDDLTNLLKDGSCLYKLPGAESSYVAWRKSIDNRDLKVQDISGVDYATMLFGLAALSDNTGIGFFTTNNRLDSPGGIDLGKMK